MSDAAVNTDVLEIYREALQAGMQAARAMVEDNPGQCYPCGFSSVTVKITRKSDKNVRKFVRALRDLKICSHDSSCGTYLFYNPGRAPTQWLPAKLAGSYAFADVLLKYGIPAAVTERID